MSTRSPDTKVELVAAHLRERARQADGPLYVKARFIATDVDLSSKEVGAALRRIADREGGLTVDRWAESRGITWRVSQP